MNNSQNTPDPNDKGSITQNYNLSFDIGKINNYGVSSERSVSSSGLQESVARASTVDQNGKSRDKGHCEKQESRSGFSSPSASIQGKPVGRRLLNNDCLDGEQEIQTSDLFPGEEAVRQPVKLSGKSFDKSHSARKSQLADPTPGLLIHPQVLRYCDPQEIDSEEKIAHMLTECYPEGGKGYELISRTEKIAISILKTGVVPSSLEKRERDCFDIRMNHINRYRRENGIPTLPMKLHRVKVKTLLPRVCTFTCSDYNRDEHRERVRLINLEYEILDWIESGTFPKMSDEEKAQIEQDLVYINELRGEENGVPLDLSKTVEEHFIDEEEEKEPCRKRNVDLVDVDMEEKDGTTDEDDELFGESDSDSDSSSDSDASEQQPRQTDEERREWLRRQIEFFNTPDSEPVARADSEPVTRADSEPVARAAAEPSGRGDAEAISRADSKPSESDDVTMEEVLASCTEKEAEEGVELRDCFVAKMLKLFLEQLDHMTKCPISHERFRDPYIASDNFVYERAEILKWLQRKTISPMTRDYMMSDSLKYDHTMRRLVKSFQECKITNDVLKHIKCAPEGTFPKVKVDVNFVLSEKRLAKKARLEKNQEAKKAQKWIMKAHKNFLKQMKFYLPCNLLTSMPSKPSYSIMHSLREGFSILMYSGSHRVNLQDWFCLHHANAIKIILPPDMMIIWHEALFHAGAKSRNNQDGIPQEDLRFFSYVWPKVNYTPGSRMNDRTDGVLRESGDRVYRENISRKICREMYKSRTGCQYCNIPSEVLDLRHIPKHSYNPGDRIMGDLDELGWIVVRGVRMTEDMYNSVEAVTKFGKKAQVVKNPHWYSIEERNNNRVMKYNHISTIHDVWYSDPNLVEFLGLLQNEVVKKALSIDKRYTTYRQQADYVLGKFNLLMNRGEVSCDQQAHTDYKPRVLT